MESKEPEKPKNISEQHKSIEYFSERKEHHTYFRWKTIKNQHLMKTFFAWFDP